MPSAVLTGQTLLNQYHVDEFITSTPLGDLYRVTDTRSNKLLALTQLPKTVAENSEAIRELDAMAGKLRNLKLADVVNYYGIFQTPRVAFLLEDWVDGPTLRDVLERSPITVHEALIYVRALCAILEVLHRQNLLYLNLIPEFVHINKQGEISLSGVAGCLPNGSKQFKSLQKHSNLQLAPEQFTGHVLSPATDTYSLTVILYQLITGTWINGKAAPKTGEAVRKAHLESTPPAPISINPNIPDNFSRMTLWALRKKPVDRLKTTTELLTSLALAAQSSVDKISLRITQKTAPTTWAILNDWEFLPVPKPNLITQDLPPLHERLTSIEEQRPRRKPSRIGVMPIFLLALVAGFLSLFWVVRPAPTSIPTPIKVTPFSVEFTPLPPTVTAQPRPTHENGGRIAFTCTRGDYNQLCMINRDGTGLSQLTNMDASNYYPIFTPDGSSLLFASNRNGAFDLYLLQFDQKELVQLTSNLGNIISPDYSPDGRQIVFANRVGEEPASIWMANADGVNARQIYKGTNTIVAVAWSPNGEKIAYAMSVGVPGEYDIFTMDITGKNHVHLSPALLGIGGSIDWATDSNSILIHAGPFNDKNIFSVNVNTSEFEQLTFEGNNAGASYSPDGRYIVFNSLRNNDQADLYIMRADGTNEVQLTNNPEPDWGAQWIQ